MYHIMLIPLGLENDQISFGLHTVPYKYMVDVLFI